MPDKYTPQLAADICQRLSEGEALSVICRDVGIHRSTFHDWRNTHPELEPLYLSAKEAGYDAIADECLDIADNGTNDYAADKDGNDVLDRDHISRSKLRVETRLKLLAKWDPKRYGDRTVLAGDPDAPLRGLSDEELDAKIAAKIAAGTANG